MAFLVGVLGILLILTILWDAFEVIILPRRVSRKVRLARLVLRTAWRLWSFFVQRIRTRGRREAYLGFYGPLMVLVLYGIWAIGLIIGFGMLQWGFGSRLKAPEGHASFGTVLYMSGTTFFTLGLGDVVPRSAAARVLVVVEADGRFQRAHAERYLIGFEPEVKSRFQRIWERHGLPILRLEVRKKQP